MIPAAENERRAPCKLNNVTNEKHQKDWLFQRALKKACLDNVNYFFEAKILVSIRLIYSGWRQFV